MQLQGLRLGIRTELAPKLAATASVAQSIGLEIHRIYLTLKNNLSVDNECKYQILSLSQIR